MALTRIKRLAAASALSISALAAAGAVQAETLRDALVSAYNTSGLLTQQRALLRATDEDVAQAIAALRPTLTYAASVSASSATSDLSATLSLSSSVTLYDFGRSDLGVELAREGVLAARDALIGVEQTVLLRTVSAYMSVLEATSLVGLGDSNVRVITQELRAANDRFEVGEVTRTDVSLAEARLASARASLAAAQGQLAVAREEYKAVTGHYPTGLSEPSRLPETANSLDAAQAIARDRHPDLKTAKRSVTVAELTVKLAELSTRPTLRGSAGLSSTDFNDPTVTASVTLGGTIYQGGSLTSQWRAAQARAEASRASLHLAGIGVDQAVGNAWAQLAIANASVEATDRAVSASRVALEGIKEEAQVGSRTTLEVLNAEQELLDAQSAAISAQVDRFVAAYTLLSAMGLMTVDHLGLGITTYDPAAYYEAVKNAPTTGISPQGQRLDNVLKALGKN